MTKDKDLEGKIEGILKNFSRKCIQCEKIEAYSRQCMMSEDCKYYRTYKIKILALFQEKDKEIAELKEKIYGYTME